MREPIKVVFLDFGGVMILNEANGLNSEANPAAVVALNEIVRATGAKIVVTSLWRREGAGQMVKTIRGWGVDGAVIGVTPFAKRGSRGREILSWLECTYYDIASFVVLDDLDCGSGMDELEQNFIQIDPGHGLTRQDAQRAISILNGETK